MEMNKEFDAKSKFDAIEKFNKSTGFPYIYWRGNKPYTYIAITSFRKLFAIKLSKGKYMIVPEK